MEEDGEKGSRGGMVVKGLQTGAERLKLMKTTRMEEWDNCGLDSLVQENKRDFFVRFVTGRAE